MPSFGATITGLDELQAKLESLRTGGAEKASRSALREAAKVIQASIRERAPIRADGPSGTALPPGAIAADINIGNVTKSRSGVLEIVIAPGKYTNHVARFVEFGHYNVSKGAKSKKNPFTPAHPFIRPGYEAAALPAAEKLAEVFNQEIDKIVTGKASAA